MKRKNATRSALFTSIISLLLCVSMLMGTTFAWFTDSVESGRNVIAAGNLDVELYHTDDDTTNEKVTTSTELFSDIELWEPGVVAYETLTVKNVGNLALKYQMSVNFENETKVNGYGLSQALKVGTIDGTLGEGTTREGLLSAVTNWTSLSSFILDGKLEKQNDEKAVTVVIYWQPGNNDFDNLFNMNNLNQGKTLSIDLGVKLMATQLTSESDSFNNQYDKMATVDDINELNAALAADYDLIQLGSNIAFTEAEMTDEIGTNKLNYALMIDSGKTVAIDLNGYTLSANYTVDTATTTWNQATLIHIANGATLIVEDSIGTGRMTFNTNIPCDDYNKSFGVVVNNAGNLVVNGGSLENIVPCPTVGPNGETTYTEYGIVSPAVDNKSTGVLTLNGGAIYSVGHNAVRNFGKIVMNGGLMKSDMFVAVDGETTSTVEIHGGELDGGKTTSIIVRGTAIVDGGFFNEKINPKTGSNLTVTGGTFAVDPSDYVTAGYVATENNGVWTVTAAN